MKLRLCLLITYCLLLTTSSLAQPDTALAKKEAAFVTACKEIVYSYYKKDVTKLNKYIHASYGVYTLYRIGVPDRYKNEKKLDKEDRLLFETNALPKPNFNKSLLKYGKLPQWSCEIEVWNKTGFVADSTKKYKPLSEIAGFEIKYEEATISKKELATLKFIEGKCRKVVFAGSRTTGLIFYMAWINSKWYLAIIDTVTVDCSA